MQVSNCVGFFPARGCLMVKIAIYVADFSFIKTFIKWLLAWNEDRISNHFRNGPTQTSAIWYLYLCKYFIYAKCILSIDNYKMKMLLNPKNHWRCPYPSVPIPSEDCNLYVKQTYPIATQICFLSLTNDKSMGYTKDIVLCLSPHLFDIYLYAHFGYNIKSPRGRVKENLKEKKFKSIFSKA